MGVDTPERLGKVLMHGLTLRMRGCRAKGAVSAAPSHAVPQNPSGPVAPFPGHQNRLWLQGLRFAWPDLP